MSFKIGSLTCVKYIEKQPTQAPQPLPLSVGSNIQSQILKKGASEKNECLGGLKAWGAYCVSCQKRLKIKYGFDDSISYADLGLFQLPSNQLMFSFVTLWFC